MRRAPLVAALLCAGCPPRPNRVTQQVREVPCEHGPLACKGYLIDQPDVQHATSRPAISFKAGDIIRVSAGGCAQTGGAGRTWKRYVDPIDDKGDGADKYYGEIRVARAMDKLQPIAEWIDCPIVVPRDARDGESFLELGYVDDYYEDNGYWGGGSDDGTRAQCAGGTKAFVRIEVTSSELFAVAELGAFDLENDTLDANNFKEDPRWAAQRTLGRRPDSHLDCNDFADLVDEGGGVFRSPNRKCSTAKLGKDVPDDGLVKLMCGTTGAPLTGHVNWEPATYHGILYWDELSQDDDYNFWLLPQCGAGLAAGDRRTLGLEFDWCEMANRFAHPWWKGLVGAISAQAGGPSGNGVPNRLLDGKPVIAIGQMGLDCEHGCKTELHPLYGIAIHTVDDPADDVWEIFVRNSGGEGFCASSNLHDLQTQRIAFRLRRPGAHFVKQLDGDGQTLFYAPGGQTSCPAVAARADDTVDVIFALPGPRTWIDGELHLSWTDGGRPRPSARRRPFESEAERGDEVEERLRRALPGGPFSSGATASCPATAPTADDKPIRCNPLAATAITAAPPVPPSVRVESGDPAFASRRHQRLVEICHALPSSAPADLRAACANAQ